MAIFKKKLNIGIDIGSSSIKIVGIRKTKKHPVLEFFRAIDLYDDGHIRNPDELNNTILSDILLELKYELDIRKERVNLTLSGPQTYLYNLEIPDISHNEIMRTIQWQLKAIVPWEIDKVELDYFPIPARNGAENQKQMILAVAEKDKLEKHMSVFSHIGMETGIVELDCLSLYNCYNYFEQNEKLESNVLINVGAYSSNCVIFQPERNMYFRNLEFGGSTINDILQKNLNLSYIEAEHIKRSKNLTQILNKFPIEQWYKVRDSLLETFERFCFELDQFIKYYQAKENVARLNAIFVTGGTMKMQNLIILMQNYLQLPVIRWSPLKYLQVNWLRNSAEIIDTFKYQIPICLGAALRND